jgi:outer membrane protein assembly factor BamB
VPTKTPSPTPQPTATPTPGSAAAADWLTFGNNNQRTGESRDATLSAANAGTLHYVWAHQNFDGSGLGAQTQPLLATGVNVGGTTHTVVYAGSGNGTLFAYDAFTGAQLWSKFLGVGQYHCGTGTAYFGVQGTPAIDRASNTIYASDGVHKVHALDLGSGSEKWSADIVAAGSDNGSSTNLHEFLHTALTFANGKVYGGTGSTCDITPWQGRVFALDVNSHTVSTFFTTYNQGDAYSGGGVWGWGGVSIDGNGSVFAAVGNADTAPQNAPFAQAPFETSGYGEQIVSLSSTLGAVYSSNSPSFTEYPSATDVDLSGTPVLFQPPNCPPLLAVQGKAGFLFIYNRGDLTSGPIAQFQFSPSSDHAHYTGLPAYSAATHLLYASVAASIGSYGPGMAIVSFGSSCTPSVARQPRFGPDAFTGFATGWNHARSTPTYANGVVFMGTGDGILWARDATTGAPLWDSNNTDGLNTHGQQWGASSSGDQIRFGPVVTGGWVYVVEARSGSLYALKVDGAAGFAALRRGAASRPLPAPPILRSEPKI